MPGVSAVRSRSAVALVVALAALGAACRPAETDPAASPAANTTDPQWIHRHDPHADVAVVFVHGIFGDTVRTWTADGRPSMFDLLHDNPAIGLQGHARRIVLVEAEVGGYFATGAEGVVQAAVTRQPGHREVVARRRPCPASGVSL